MKKNGMGEACDMWAYRTGAYSVWRKRLKERDHLKNKGVDGKILLRRTLKK
jgi:hypothetical protein